ncbi:glycosyl-4,4'-diaponeurosporenoate acyltransferase [Macrococcus carouselicus]|nr:glycosyl-4,4'-diaponeurosporenoate acyltransferase [Macrococcus carouselicus]
MFAWFTIQMTISYLMMKLPVSYFVRMSPLFRSFKWEQQGEVWHKLFSVKSWKAHLPDSSIIFSASYNHREIGNTATKTLQSFNGETNRAELTHWLSLLLFPLFYLWNPKWAARINVLYALLSNLPFIIIQRYNRPKVQRLLAKRKGRGYDTT